jgi:protein O-GlcNAc transferase
MGETPMSRERFSRSLRTAFSTVLKSNADPASRIADSTMSCSNLFHLGLMLRDQGKLDQAIATLRDAHRADPQHVDTLSALAEILCERGDLDGAVSTIHRALALRPDDPIALDILGTALYRKGQLDEAAEACRRAITIRPQMSSAHLTLGNILRELGEFDAAIASYRGAVALSNDPIADSNLLYALYFHPGYDGPSILAEHLRWDRQHAQPLRPQIRPHDNDRNPDRRLRIGYVSPHFCSHVLSLHFVPLFANHDHQQFEVFFYSSVIRPDAITQRLRSYADVWRDCLGMSDEDLAQQVRADRIDILVDLTMHMANGRPLLFARKPAPIQVACDAYPGTTGLSTMDYRLTDPWIDPPGEHDDWYTEKSIRLPDSFWVYDPLTTEPAVNELPALGNGYVTFGALHTFSKVHDAILRLWAAALNRVPNSRLLMLAYGDSVRSRILSKMASEGIRTDRIEFVGRQSRAEYLKLYHRIDIHLDTQPYCAHATALDSLWMGVSMVTLIGRTLVGRAGWCYLNNLGLPELAAETNEEFVQIAADLVADLPRLAALRATLRQRMEFSPLMDGKKFANACAAIFRDIWREWCATTT